eukprot:TRINITY_DN6884_c0_g1_i1.p1 TRINITY_DN6884_c0_g1~~TRINITY_DN6884_c0_g1_i1.p1  ORF type:complete len:187 (+),score=13.14 TRINITY_DN6884_c0_g1_i1:45-605(+)
MYGEKGIELVREISRVDDQLPPFNEDVVRQTLEETRTLWEKNRADVAENEVVTPLVTFRHTAVHRNTRCMLAYLNFRMEKIRGMRWHFGAILPEEIRLNLCEPELEFFSKYNRLLGSYMGSVGTDMTVDLTPPKSLYIDVRVKQDYGELETPDGQTIQLKVGTQYYLPREFCEHLIVQGVLEHVSS